PGRRRAGQRGRRRARQPELRCAGYSRVHLSQQLHIIVLDHRIGEELVGRLLECGFRLLAVGRFDLDVEHLALAHAGHARDAERPERALDRLALRVEDAGLEGYGDAGLHGVLMRSAAGCLPGIDIRAIPAVNSMRALSSCTGAPASPNRGPHPATWPLSPTSRIAAQNAAGVLDTTGTPWRSSSGLATPSVRKPPQEIRMPSA